MRMYIALQLEDRTQGPKAMQERTLFGVFDFRDMSYPITILIYNT